MKKKKIVVISFLAVGAALIITNINKPVDTHAAVLVHDEQNIAEAIKSATNTAQTVINTAEQVKIGIRNLASLDAGKLLSQYIGVNDQVKELTDLYQGYTGILSAGQDMKDKWNNAFGSVDNIFNGSVDVGDYWNNQQKTLKNLGQTYYDVAKTANNTVKTTQTRQEQLSDAMDNAANADGEKGAIQAGNQIDAINAASMIENNNLLAQQIATTAAKYQKEANEEAAGMKLNEQSINDAKEYGNKLNIETKPVQLPESW